MRQELTFGEWLRTRRKALDITQEELADRLGCSRTAIQKIEGGQRRPSRQFAELLADLLKVTPEERDEFVRFARLGEMESPGAYAGFHPEPASGASPAPMAGAGDGREEPQVGSEVPRSNLPTALTRLIGREEEQAAALDLLSGDRVRILTLVGPPGIGKTRLGLAIAEGARAAGRFEDGVFFAGLAAITDPQIVPTTIAGALGLKEGGGPRSPAEQLKEHLRDKQALLFLDNFEQVLDASLYVVELLSECPHTKVLATSREALRVSGERQFSVPPLEVPAMDNGRQTTDDRRQTTETDVVHQLQSYPAIALFVERAQAANPSFELEESNARDVAAICGRLDGLPLAIELVAARTSILSPMGLLERLDKPLALLTGGPRDLSPRHRTLRNAIAWSYDLLEKEERTVFARLGAFVGGCTLSAVEGVCNANGDLDTPVLDIVDSLLHKNLLKREGQESAGGDPRFTMLETVREYALERLAASGEAREIRRLHAEFYLALAEAAQPELNGPAQGEWLARLEIEHDNLRASLQWSIDASSGSGAQAEEVAEIGLRMAGALFWFWEMHGHLSEGRAWLNRALALPHLANARSKKARAKALDANGWLAMRLSDDAYVRAAYEESLEIYRELGDKEGTARSLSGLASITFGLGEFATAGRLHEESLAIRREIGHRQGITASLNNLGLVAYRLGDYERSVQYFTEGLSLARELGGKERISLILCNFGKTLLRQGEYGQARSLLQESLALVRELEYELGIALALWALGSAAHAQGETRRAILLLGATQGLFDRLGISVDEIDREPFARMVTELKAGAGEEAFEQLWSEGKTGQLQRMIDYALEAETQQAE